MILNRHIATRDPEKNRDKTSLWVLYFALYPSIKKVDSALGFVMVCHLFANHASGAGPIEWRL